MTLTEFRETLEQESPAVDLPVALRAMWYAGKGDWDASHDLCQESTKALDWVHAWLHRQEGDLPNANYWYQRAGRTMSASSLEDEWTEITETLLNL